MEMIKVNKDLITTLIKLKLALQDEIENIETYYNHYDEQIFYDGQINAYNKAIDFIDVELEKLT